MNAQDKISLLRFPIILAATFLLILSIALKSIFCGVFAVFLGWLLYRAIESSDLKSLHKTKLDIWLSKFKYRKLSLIKWFLGLVGIVFIVSGFSDKSLFVLAFVGALFLVASYYLNIFPEIGNKINVVVQKNTDHGSAGWANPYEIYLSSIFSNDKGLYIGGSARRSRIGHITTVAGSRQGKGTCLIIPSLLVNPHGSYVVTDPKGENAFITARFQKESGQNVFIIDPWNEQAKYDAKHGIEKSGFNPFSFLRANPEELRDNCELIASYLVPDNPNTKDPYWNDRARSMIKIFLMHIVTSLPKEEHDFWTLYKMLRYSGDDWLRLLFDLQNNMAEDGLISIAAQELIGIEKSGNTMAGIKSTAQNVTTIFESPQLRKSLSADEFDPYELTNGKTTVYFILPERFLKTHSVWLRMMVGLSLKACNAKPKQRVNFLIDEFAVLGKMQDIIDGFAFSAGQNILLWIFVQSLSQLKEIYGETGLNTLINNSVIFQAFGLKDAFSTEYVSKMLGEATFEKTVLSHSEGSSGQGISSSTNRSVQSYGRRLLTPDEVERHTGIITIADGYRISLQKVPYYKSAFADENMSGFQAKFLVELNQRLEIVGKTADLHEQFTLRADPPPRVVN